MIDRGPLKEITEDEKDDGTHQKGKERLDSCPEKNGIGNTHPLDHHLPLREVEDPHHTKNKGEA